MVVAIYRVLVDSLWSLSLGTVHARNNNRVQLGRTNEAWRGSLGGGAGVGWNEGRGIIEMRERFVSGVITAR